MKGITRHERSRTRQREQRCDVAATVTKLRKHAVKQRIVTAEQLNKRALPNRGEGDNHKQVRLRMSFGNNGGGSSGNQ